MHNVLTKKSTKAVLSANYDRDYRRLTECDVQSRIDETLKYIELNIMINFNEVTGKKCLESNKTILRPQRKFKSELHNVLTKKSTKAVLSANFNEVTGKNTQEHNPC